MKTKNTVEINGVKILKNGVKDATGKYSPCWYSVGPMTDGQEAVTIYARCILSPLPKALGNVRNDTDMQSDYFESDCVRFNKGTSEFDTLLPFARR